MTTGNGNLKIGLLGWDECGAIRWSYVELRGPNAELRAKIRDLVERTAGELAGTRRPTPYDLGHYLGRYGNPLTPLDTGLMLLKGWAELNGLDHFGQERLGDEGVLTMMTVFRDVFGGLFQGAREAEERDTLTQSMYRTPKPRKLEDVVR